MADYEERNMRNRNYMRFRSTLHIGMGMFYIVVGTLILYVKYFGAMELPTGVAYALGSLMLLYGIFRLWRGLTDMRNNRRRQ